jgi:hypothetical protein
MLIVNPHHHMIRLELFVIVCHSDYHRVRVRYDRWEEDYERAVQAYTGKSSTLSAMATDRILG